jgi:hypothetical protein
MCKEFERINKNCLTDETKENHDKFQNSRPSGRDLNSGSPEYEAVLLLTSRWCSVIQNRHQHYLYHYYIKFNASQKIKWPENVILYFGDDVPFEHIERPWNNIPILARRKTWENHHCRVSNPVTPERILGMTNMLSVCSVLWVELGHELIVDNIFLTLLQKV